MFVEIDDPATPHEQRATIGVRLSLLDDPRCGVGLHAGGYQILSGARCLAAKSGLRVKLGPFVLNHFTSPSSPVTWIQYRAFIEAEDGFRHARWWDGLLFQLDELHRQSNQRDNHPVDNVCWLEAVAFCRWLTAKLGYDVRLPTEWEWQQAATGGDADNEYPWGPSWDSGRTNTYESGVFCSTAVGMYPHGSSPVGALDMSGNVWELCLNEYDNPNRLEVSGDARRALRGGSWGYGRNLARAACRNFSNPDFRYDHVGFRLCGSSPIF